MKEMILKFVRDEEGLTTVEYAVAGALITVAVVGAFTLLGNSVAGTINTIEAVLP
jgi:pilus assembly protein Flp/PilA